MTKGLSFSAAKQIGTEEVVTSKHLNAGCGPPKDQRTKTDGMALLLIPEGGLHSSTDSLQCLHFYQDTQPSQSPVYKRCIGITDKRFITHPTHKHIYTTVSSATPGHHLTLK